jgi:hypothetical protein
MSHTSFACRSCGAVAPHKTVISLGHLPLGNDSLAANELGSKEDRFPLELAFCDTCTLVQVREPIPPEKLMHQYLYFTSASPAVLDHQHRMAEHLIERLRLGRGSTVMEVGSNDGTMLKWFRDRGMPVLGIEPIDLSARVAEEQMGVPTVVELFTHDLARRLTAEGRRADLIIANYVLELVPDVADFIRGFRDLLTDDGVAVVEVPYVKSMIEQGRFDGIAHLRLSWFSVTSFDAALERQGMVLSDIEYLRDFRGGTLRVYASPSGKGRARGAEVEKMLAQEKAAGLDRSEYYSAFGARVADLCHSIREFVQDARRSRKRVAGYGAGIKASTLLNAVGLDKAMVDFVVDANPYKQGRFMPGVHIPVYAPDRLVTEKPDYVLMLAMDLHEEVLEQQAHFREAGGRFVIPVPGLRLE